MKRILIATLYFLAMHSFSYAQQKFTQFSLRGGLDLGHQYNQPSVIKMPLTGFNAGLSIDKYWSFWGIGIDVDAYKNKAATYDSAGLGALATPWAVKSFTDSASKLNRYFAGIGPSFKYQGKGSHLVAELNLRGGISYIDGGNHKADAVFTDPLGAINMSMYNHSGYKEKLVGAIKAQARINYYFTPKLALQVGAYYLYHVNSEASYSYSEIISLPLNVNYVTDISSVSSYGAFAGISYRIFSKKKIAKKLATTPPVVTNSPIIKAAQQPVVKDVIVYIKDELTSQPLYQSSVTMTSASGKIVTNNTDKNGMVRFSGTTSEAYTINATLNDIATTAATISKERFNESGQELIITLTHNDPRFTLVGKAVNKNTGGAESDVSVTLTNETKSSVRMSSSQATTGEFRFQLDGASDFNIVGKKQQYLSNIERLSTKGLNRSQALYVQLELGVEEAATGKKIQLDNIYYDLNKTEVSLQSGTDLEKLLIFLKDNETLTIELSSHTDSRGSDAYNLKLSQQRAQSVVNYLIKNGIAKNRMIPRGYGETQLVNKCDNGTPCTENEHKKNRRTEIKVIGK